MKLLFLLSILLFMSKPICAQDWLLGSSSNFTNEAFDVKKDAQGNSIITGYFSGQTNFQGTILQTQNGYSDIYVVKINSLGNVVWAKSFGGNQADRGLKLAIDNTDNIFVTGYFSGTMIMGATTLTSNNNSRDFFLAKLNSSGDVIWARSDGGSMGETAYDLTLDSQNNCILTGQFEGTTNIGGTSFTSQWDPVNNIPSFDIFIAKFDASGSPIWVKNALSEYEDRGISITCDANDNIYVTGQFSDTLIFLGQTVNNQIYNAGFVAKISPGGSSVWFRKLAASQTLAYDIELNAVGEVYITGDFLGSMSFWDNAGLHQITNPYTKKVFLMKITNQGEFIWGKANGSESEVSSRALLIDDVQDVYIGGYFKCNFDQYRDSTATGLWNSVGFRDIFMSKFSPVGDMIWNKHSGGKKDDMCYALALGNNDEPVFAGSFTNHLNIPASSFQLSNYTTNGSVHYESENFPFYEIQGDETKNSFVGKVINTSTPPLFYYQNLPYDSISPDLLPVSDTLEGCAQLDIYFHPFTFPLTGPGYNVDWSDGTHNYHYPVNETHPASMVYLTTERWDGCSSFNDSIFVIPHDAPPMPLLTDDHAFNDSTPVIYNIIKLCYPDTAQVWFSDLCTNCTMETTNPDGSWTIAGTGPFPVWEAGNYTVTVTNEWGCTETKYFKVQVLYVIPPDTMVLDLVLNDPLDWNDSIKVCEGQAVQLVATDLLTNPTGDYLHYNHVYADDSYSALNFSGISTDPLHYGHFVPTYTGWYVIQYDAWLGTMNMCGIDTAHFMVVDSFYVEVLPNPTMIQPVLTSNGPICPGELIYLSTSATYTGFSWSGTAITWTSASGDSIQLTQPGQYSYHGSYTDPVTGCSAGVNTSITITEKAPPPILMNPEDGIVCPFDSVHLQIIQAGSYNWFGPEGYSLGTGADIYATEQGFYHCVFTDNDGCEMTTPQVEVKEFTTPYLEFTPGNSLCITGEVEITAIYGGDAVIQWIAPLNSSSNSVIVTTPGTYYCQITQCGITITDSVVVTESTFSAMLTASDTMLCHGDEITLSTIPGMAQYEWTGGTASGSSITVTTPGVYQVTVTNSEGCISVSQIVNIGEHAGSSPPIISDVEICPGADVTLIDNSGQTTFWYSDSTSALPDFTGNSLFIPVVTSDTMIYVAYENLNCPQVFEAVEINVNETLAAPIILGDLEICSGTVLQLTTDSITDVAYSWIYNNDTVSTSSFCNIPANQIIPGELIYLSIHNLCASASDSTSIILMPLPTLSLNVNTLTLCGNSAGELYASNLFSGDLHWQNGTNSYQQDTLSLDPTTLTNQLVTAYVVDSEGCQSFTDSVYVSVFDAVPSIDNVVICPGNSVTLSNNSTYITSWFAQDSTLISAGNTLTLNNILTDTTIYAAYANPYCPLVYDSISIIINDTVPIPPIIGNLNVCVGTSLQVETTFYPDMNYTWLYNGNVVSNNFQCTVPGNQLAPTGTITVIISNDCSTAQDSATVIIVPQDTLRLNIDSLIVCAGIEHQFFPDTLFHGVIQWQNGINNFIEDTLNLLASEITDPFLIAYGTDTLGCITLADTVVLYIPDFTFLEINSSDVPCFGSSVTLESNTDATDIHWITYSGDTVAGTNLLIQPVNYANDGWYYLHAVDALYGCELTDSIKINPIPLPVFDVHDTTICTNNLVWIYPPVSNGWTFQWNNGDTLAISPNVSDIYLLTATNALGCSFTDSVIVNFVNCDPQAANVMTANGDGINDFFTVPNAEFMYGNYLIILNRWGNVVYETDDYKNQFDGGELSEGVYFYRYFPQGKSKPYLAIEGFFHLIR